MNFISRIKDINRVTGHNEVVADAAIAGIIEALTTDRELGVGEINMKAENSLRGVLPSIPLSTHILPGLTSLDQKIRTNSQRKQSPRR